MAKMGRPKVDKPINHVVTVKFNEEDYQVLLEYANEHNLSVSQILRIGAYNQINEKSSGEKSEH